MSDSGLENRLAECDAILAKYHMRSDTEARDNTAEALLWKGATLVQLSRADEALACFTEFLARFDDGCDTSPPVISSLFQRGSILQAAGKYEDSLEAFETVLGRLSDDLPALPYVRIEALWGKASDLQYLARPREAVSTLACLIARYTGDSRLIVQRYIAQALIAQGWLTERTEDAEGAIALFDQVVVRFGDSDDLELRQSVANALSRRARLIQQSAGGEAAARRYDEIIARLAQSTEPGISLEVADALYHEALNMCELGHEEDALETFDSLFHRIASGRSERARMLAALTLARQTRLFASHGEYQELATVSIELIARFVGESDPGVSKVLRDALLDANSALAIGECWEQVIHVSDALIARLELSNEASARGLAGLAMIDKVCGLAQLKRMDEARDICDIKLPAFADETIALLDRLISARPANADAREKVDREVTARYRKALLLGMLDRPADAIATFSDLVEDFADSADPAVARVVTAARECRAELRPAAGQ